MQILQSKITGTQTSFGTNFGDYVPKSLTQPLAQAKNGDPQFWKPNIHAANG
jgi:hypothetical protein